MRRAPPGASRHHPELKNPHRPERQDDDRPQDHREEEGHREWEVALKEQKVHLDALQVLEDEDQDHDQNHHANHQRCPRPTEAGLSLARIRFLGLCALAGGTFIHVENSKSRRRAATAH